MKHVDEYRDRKLVDIIAAKILKLKVPECQIMEICGGQTHAIMKYDLGALLPENVQLIHGPGCPVCVTPADKIDKALELARSPKHIVTSFGDMLRVPGNGKDLFSAKAEGADVRTVYSPLDALKTARDNPQKEVVFFAIGFETTAPVNALALLQAEKTGLENFSLLCSQVLVPPAMEFILSTPDNRLNGFLAAGHVCTVTGYKEYFPIAQKYQIPMAVTGFEPVDILQGIHSVLQQIELGTHKVLNEYKRSVNAEGNLKAQKTMMTVFEIVDRNWRGIGTIPKSGLGIKEKYKRFDAETKFGLSDTEVKNDSLCMAGEILQGKLKPDRCPAFGKTCTPENPLGAPMVSDEGACSAYIRFKNR